MRYSNQPIALIHKIKKTHANAEFSVIKQNQRTEKTPHVAGLSKCVIGTGLFVGLSGTSRFQQADSANLHPHCAQEYAC